MASGPELNDWCAINRWKKKGAVVAGKKKTFASLIDTISVDKGISPTELLCSVSEQCSWSGTVVAGKKKTLNFPMNTISVDKVIASQSVIVFSREGAFLDGRTQWLLPAATAAGSNLSQKVWQVGSTEIDQWIDISTISLPIHGSNLGWPLLNQPRFIQTMVSIRESLGTF